LSRHAQVSVHFVFGFCLLPFVYPVMREIQTSQGILDIKKGPLEEPVCRAWELSPDGYTILPMRLPTTRIIADVFMGRFDKGKSEKRQWVPAG